VVVGAGILLLPAGQPASRPRSGSTRPPDPKAIASKQAAAKEGAEASAGPSVELAESTRRTIYAEALQAELRAAAAVPAPGDSKSNPLGPGLVAGPERLAKQELKRKGQIQALADRYRAELAAHHGIGLAQLDEILDEGRVKHWPAPAP